MVTTGRGSRVVGQGEKASEDIRSRSRALATYEPVGEDILLNILDVLERIQAQLGLITGVHLEKEERINDA